MRFVDRDMLARHTGMCMGSKELQATQRATIDDDERLVQEVLQAVQAKTVCESTSMDADSDNNVEFDDDKDNDDREEPDFDDSHQKDA